MTKNDLKLLKDFLFDSTPFNASRLITILALYRVLQTEWSQKHTYSRAVKQVVQWLHDRADKVWEDLIEHGACLEPAKEGKADDWRRVCNTRPSFTLSILTSNLEWICLLPAKDL